MARFTTSSGFSSALDYGVAALAAGSAGLVAFAMPEDLFSSLVVKSGLPNLVSAAQPPLGDTARLATVAAAALVTFLFVWSLLRALDRPSAQQPAAAPESEEPALRLRKADAHPDAPARRPILAGRELGEPVEPFDPAADELLLGGSEAEAQAPAHPEPTALPGFLVPQDEHEEEPEPQAEPEAEAPAAAAAEPEQAEASDEPGEDADLSRLMARFETGLVRKRQAIERPAPAGEPAPEPAAAAPSEPSDQVGHRLRSAIAGLQRSSGTAA